MPKLIAFDQALNTSGYSVFVNGKLSDHGKFTTIDSSTGDKLVDFKDFIDRMFEAENPDKVVFEGIQLQQIPGSSAHGNVDTFRKLAYVQSILIESLTRKGIPYEIVSASTWKSTCGVRGRNRGEQKRSAQEFVQMEFGVQAIQDVIDAICIGTHIIKEDDKEINWE